MPRRTNIDINILFEIIIKMIGGLILCWFILVTFEMIQMMTFRKKLRFE
jgi:hypothetical protein